jgi:DNA (cytosine-5)-methyltransferase 1
LLANGDHVKGLLKAERLRLWTLVIAGNEPENDVAAVTRGSHGYVDIDRLLSATEANVVKELKRYPEKLGLLATSLDARILHMDMLTALAVARAYGDEPLHALMRSAGMATNPSAGESASSRLESSELGQLLAANALGTRRRGSRPGGGTTSAFASLAKIARTNDGAINRAIGEALKQTGLIDSYEDEKEVGGELALASDLYLVRAGEPIRVEVMWRSGTSRAGIANYALGKLRNYGRTIGYLA